MRKLLTAAVLTSCSGFDADSLVTHTWQFLLGQTTRPRKSLVAPVTVIGTVEPRGRPSQERFADSHGSAHGRSRWPPGVAGGSRLRRPAAKQGVSETIAAMRRSPSGGLGRLIPAPRRHAPPRLFLSRAAGAFFGDGFVGDGHDSITGVRTPLGQSRGPQ
jgi:hypothetical protein